MRSIYRKIAKENGTTIEEVKREMQAALNDAYTSLSNNGIIGAYQNRVPRKGDIPTPEEFIRYASNATKDKLERNSENKG